MQALGNDFILIDIRKKRLKKIPQLSKTLCDRRFGVGADQVLLINNSKKADFKIRIFNADGSEVEMCGNGVRCIAKYVWDNKVRGQARLAAKRGSGLRAQKLRKKNKKPTSLTIETLAGIMHIKKRGSLFVVDMGEPILEPEKIPVSLRVMRNLSPVLKHPLIINGRTFNITCVSMGNPHAVIVVNNVQTVQLSQYGPVIENHHLFPRRTNVEFIQILNRKNIKMRVWERGAGETMACGTGASAACVASSLLGLTDRKATIHLPGGKLIIDWSVKDNHVYMTGPAVKVFEGTFDLRQ